MLIAQLQSNPELRGDVSERVAGPNLLHAVFGDETSTVVDRGHPSTGLGLRFQEVRADARLLELVRRDEAREARTHNDNLRRLRSQTRRTRTHGILRRDEKAEQR